LVNQSGNPVILQPASPIYSRPHATGHHATAADGPNNAQELEMSLISYSQRATGARSRRGAGSLLTSLTAMGWTGFAQLMRKRQCKRDLLHVRDLPDHLLRDIGIQRGNIVAAVYGGRGRA